MAVRLVWSREALEDIEAIARYIERDSPAYARAVVVKIFNTARDLKQHPYSGRVVPELACDDVRERFVYSYRVIYHASGDEVCIVAVVHGNRLLAPLLEHRD
ncbi:MAG: type II toxin-antitoxin system RelE/ParE family toxin [Woeseiaceae bacterium]|nr:type II toxin-antitoxin system RelE/ParE family toxin [Woeseiaceae bacterium]